MPFLREMHCRLPYRRPAGGQKRLPDIAGGGELGMHPRPATELPEIVKKAEIPEIIDRCVEYYKNHCVGGERLGEIMGKNGMVKILKNHLLTL